jgi:hypothetical protein
MSDNKQHTNNGRDAETGRFLPGNSGNGGRPKGSRNRLTEQFISDLCHEWEKSGPAALEEIAKTSPVDYVRVVAALVPHKVDLAALSVNIDLLAEQTSFAAAYKLARSIIDTDEMPLIEAKNEARDETPA